MVCRTFDGKKFKYWASTADGAAADRKAESKCKTGFNVRIVRIHPRQFDLHIRKA